MKKKYSKGNSYKKNNYDWIGNGIPALQNDIEVVLKAEDDINVSRKRYDELIKKEALLEVIDKAFNSINDYRFHEAVGYILGRKEES